MDKVKVNLVVMMHGGTIQQVFFDNEEVEVGRVVFTEFGKYVESEVVEVKDGPLAGECIYSEGAAELGGPDLFKPVMEAADRHAKGQYDADASIPLGDEQEA